MHKLGKQMLATVCIGAVLTGGSYSYGRHRIQEFLRRGIDPSLCVHSLRLEPDCSSLTLSGVTWEEAEGLNHIQRAVVSRPSNVLASGRWQFDAASLEGVHLQGFGEAAQKIFHAIARRMWQHGVVVANEATPAEVLDPMPIIRAACSQSESRWQVGLVSVQRQVLGLREAAATALQQPLPDINPLRGQRDAQLQLDQLHRLQSQIAAIDDVIEDDHDRWSAETQRVREECLDAIQQLQSTQRDRLRQRRRGRVEANVVALQDACIHSLASRFLPPIATAARIAGGSDRLLCEAAAVPPVRGKDFFGLSEARSIRFDRIRISGSASDPGRVERFQGEVSVESGPGKTAANWVVLVQSTVEEPRSFRICGNCAQDGSIRLTSSALVDLHRVKAATPTDPNLELAMTMLQVKLSYHRAAEGDETFRIDCRSPATMVHVRDDASAARGCESGEPIALPEFCGWVELAVLGDTTRIDSDLAALDAIVAQMEDWIDAAPVAKGDAPGLIQLNVDAAIESAVGQLLAVRRSESRQLRVELAELQKAIGTRREVLAKRLPTSDFRTATTEDDRSAPAVR